jgi:hypothetical protein
MSIGGNPNLFAVTGVVQQKGALAAYLRQINRPTTFSTAGAPDPHDITIEERQEHDTTVISRVAIAVLESTQTIGDETVIRGDDSTSDALAFSQKQIIEHTDEALRAQSNQTSEQLRALYEP